ncbi:MarR family winged helix-turn-helix transcriptional regulator [Motiliproteus sp. SC1-56]|uniref:MarR family winged helix-turn-helix transcriptional regulator n=1 Tax=Motiliproteus sp. SC1-56 TaxID=2799565 RepID=UPI00351CB2A5
MFEPMAESLYWHDVLISLRRIIRATDLQSKRMVKSCGLTIPQVMVLRAIDLLGDVTVKRISDDVSLSQATVTTILNRLEDRKLVERVRCQSDKRIVNARLTDCGREMLMSVPPLLHEKFIERFDALEDWEKTQIISALQRVATMMDAESIDAAPLLDIAPTRVY